MKQWAFHESVVKPASIWPGKKPLRQMNAIEDMWLNSISVVTFSSAEEVEFEWRHLEKFSSVPSADYAWAKAWYEAHAEDPNLHPVIVVGRAVDGNLLFLLPLICKKYGPFKILAWPGEGHLAYQCGLFTPECRRMVTPSNAKAFWNRVFAAIPDADAITASGLPSFEISNKNPLLQLPWRDYSCASYRMALDDDWDKLYLAKTNSKTRSNDRRCERRLADAGELHLRIANTSQERQHLFSVLVDQKSTWFDKQGVPNFFDNEPLRTFYEKLIQNGDWNSNSSVFLSALELDGRLISVNLGIIQDKTFYGMILSMELGEIEKFAPGRILLRQSIEYLCHSGIEIFDFGAGEDRFKDQWYDEEVSCLYVLVPFNVRGWIYVTGLKFFLNVKKRIKQSPYLWSLFARCRKNLGC